MEGVKILTDLNPKLSLLNNDVTITFQIANESKKEIPKNFYFEAKEEIQLLKEKVSLEEEFETFKMNLCTSVLDKINDNDILNVSVLEIKLINLAENFSYEKKFIVQVMKDKDNLYKNII